MLRSAEWYEGYAPSIYSIASENYKEPALKTAYDAIAELLSEAIEDTKKTYGR